MVPDLERIVENLRDAIESRLLNDPLKRHRGVAGALDQAIEFPDVPQLMLLVVQRHRLSRYVGLQRVQVVRQFG